MYCSNCGQPLQADVAFCMNCGAKVTNLIQQPQSTINMPSTSRGAFTGTQYIIEQKIVTKRDTYGIKDRAGNLLAYVKKKIVSVGPQFWFESPDGTRLGEIHGKILTVRPTFEIYDSQRLVAVVKKKILKLLGTEWWLEDPSGREIARIKGNITAHNFTIETSSSGQIAQINKKWVSVRDAYGIDILNRAIDPYIIVAYVIAMDNVEYSRSKFNVGFGIY